MSASSLSSPHASRSAVRVITAVCCASSSNGNCAMPTMRNVRGASAARLESQPVRRVTSLPIAPPTSSISDWFTTRSGGARLAPRSAPVMRVHGRRAPGSMPVNIRPITGRPVCQTSPVAVRIGTASATPGSLAICAAAPVASVRRMPPGSGESVAVTRTSKPTLSSRSRNDTTSPRDSSSMSNSSAPTAAMPMMPSAVRPGCRTRLLTAKIRALIDASTRSPRPAATTMTRRRWRPRQAARPPSPNAARRQG